MSDEKQDKSQRGLETLAIQAMMKNKDVRDFMWRMLEQAGTFTDNFSADPVQHAKNAGKRSLGLWVDSELREAEGSYFEMLRENFDGR